MTRALTAAVAAAGLVPAAAHHSNVIFDLGTVITVRGAVTRYDWHNPHVYLYIASAGDSGTEWLVEADPTPIMARSGWGPDTLAVGDPVTVRAHPDATGRPAHALLISMAKADGVLLTMRSGGRSAAVPAPGIAGVWDGLRGANSRTFVYGKLTEKGRRAKQSYRESMNPVIDCVPFPTPSIVSAPYLHEIVVEPDRIVLRTELFRVERTVYMDGRGHPADGERSNQGHSIGRWDGDTLVIDTVAFADYRAGNRSGIPSGASKHVIERLRLSEDRTQMIVEYRVEDPEFLAEPMTGETFWDYAPDRKLEPFDCDPDNARLYASD
jgi:hypothetical protein